MLSLYLWARWSHRQRSLALGSFWKGCPRIPGDPAHVDEGNVGGLRGLLLEELSPPDLGTLLMSMRASWEDSSAGPFWKGCPRLTLGTLLMSTRASWEDSAGKYSSTRAF